MLRKETADRGSEMTEGVVMDLGDASRRTRMLRKETADRGSGFMEFGQVLRLV
jgi:hypothetical protein